MLVITARVRPYAHKWVNIVEGLMLLDLVLISAYFLDSGGDKSDDFSIFLLILPFIFFALYMMIKTSSFLK